MGEFFSKHDKGEAIQRVITLAGMVVLTTPKRRPKHSVSAYVPWSLIDELSEALTAAGVDMIIARKRMEDNIARDKAK